MPKIKIWSEKEIDLYDNPPIFNAYHREQFFNLPAKLQKRVASFYSIDNKIGFHVMYAYFKARRRFFTVQSFRQADIQFLCQRFGLLFYGADRLTYNRKTYNRHRTIILQHFGYAPFKLRQYHPLIMEWIQIPLQSFDRLHLMLGVILEQLEYRHIEQPSYYMLQTILTLAVQKRNRKLHQKVEQLLKPEQKTVLDALLLRVDKEAQTSKYVFTDLKKLIRKANPKSIRINIEKYNILWQVYEQTQSLIAALKLNDAAIRYFGELVIKYKSNQITRRSFGDKYLLLIGFTVFQIRQFEDQLTDILLSVCNSAISAAKNEYKAYLFDNRIEQQQKNKQLKQTLQNKEELISHIKNIAWQPNEVAQPAQKIVKIQELLPLVSPTSENEAQQEEQTQPKDIFLDYLEKQSISLQKKASPIVKTIHFDPKTSPEKLTKAIEYFQKKQGKITTNAPYDFLADAEQKALWHENGKLKTSLYKILLFRAMHYGIKSGRLNLKYSYRYKAFDQYLIEQKYWNDNKNNLLEKANLSHLKSWKSTLEELKPLIHKHFCQTNDNIIQGKNPYFNLPKNGKYHVKTPKVEKEQTPSSHTIFPSQKLIPLTEILATIDQITGYLGDFKHYQRYFKKQRPNNSVFFAAIMAYGCNIGVETMAGTARGIAAAELENIAHWYFDLENIKKATDTINIFVSRLELPNRIKKHQDQLHTSSDGQKLRVASDKTIDAVYSFKYFGSGKGITAYGHIDERSVHFHSTIFTTGREAIYVVDGLLHNEAIRSTMHSTDTHGYTEAIFGLMHLLGFEFAPRIAKLFKQQLYSFEKIETYRSKGYSVLPSGYINEELIEENWDAILRLVTSIKSKYCTAAQIFKRLNSYSRQHPVYKALKEYGRIIKTIYILRYINAVELRQVIQKQLNMIELSNRLSDAVSIGNGGELVFLTHREQLIADACKNLIKSAIVCWNYLFTTRYIQSLSTTEEKNDFIEKMKSGTMMVWRHIYFNGIFDFSDEKLTDSFNLINSPDFNLFREKI